MLDSANSGPKRPNLWRTEPSVRISFGPPRMRQSSHFKLNRRFRTSCGKAERGRISLSSYLVVEFQNANQSTGSLCLHRRPLSPCEPFLCQGTVLERMVFSGQIRSKIRRKRPELNHGFESNPRRQPVVIIFLSTTSAPKSRLSRAKCGDPQL
jgi:hypothetical protein